MGDLDIRTKCKLTTLSQDFLVAIIIIDHYGT